MAARSVMRGSSMTIRCTSLALLLLAAVPARADDRLRVDAPRTLAVTGAAALVALVVAPRLAARSCRWCGVDVLDDEVEEGLVWRDASAARTASDVLANGVIPAAALATIALSAWSRGRPANALEDGLVIVEAATLAAAVEALAKDGAGRLRPGEPPTAGGAATQSFYSGHTSLAFSLVAATGTVSTLRGYPATPWVWGGGVALATGVAYLRVAGEAHWATDVLAGAAAGGLVGFAVPWFLHRAGAADTHGVAVVPAPGGVAVRF